MTKSVGFTIRMPAELRDQIDARAKVNHRNRNQQINAMLEHLIDQSVGSDLEVIRRSGGQTEDEPLLAE